MRPSLGSEPWLGEAAWHRCHGCNLVCTQPCKTLSWRPPPWDQMCFDAFSNVVEVGLVYFERSKRTRISLRLHSGYGVIVVEFEDIQKSSDRDVTWRL